MSVIDFTKERVIQAKRERAAQLHKATNPYQQIDKLYPMNWLGWWAKYDRWIVDNLEVVKFYGKRTWVRTWGVLIFLGLLLLTLAIVAAIFVLQR